MVNSSLIEAIVREHDDPGAATTRQIREIYNSRSGEEPILQHSEEDQQFQTILVKTIQSLPVDDDNDQPISYTVKLKDADDRTTPTLKRRSIIKLPKESKEESDSDESSSDSEKQLQTASAITISKPFSPLFMNNMKKFGVSTDWLAKRSNSLRQSAYSLSSVKSNTSRLDAMIKSASAKPIRSNRKLSFIESPTSTRVGEIDKENTDPLVVKKEKSEEEEEEEVAMAVEAKPAAKPTPYDLSSDSDEEKTDDTSPSKEFSLRIPRISLPEEEKKQRKSSSSSSSSPPSFKEESEQEKPVVKKKRRNTKSKKKTEETPKSDEKSEETSKSDEKLEATPDEDTKKISQKKDADDRGQLRVDHLKKLLRLSGIRPIMKKSELEPYSSNKAKIKYLKSLFDAAGFTGSLSIKECEKFRQKRDTEKELLEIQANVVDVKGHVKGGRTLRGQARANTTDSETTSKRKRTASSEVESNDNSSDHDDNDEKPIVKKRRVLKMVASPEVSDEE